MQRICCWAKDRLSRFFGRRLESQPRIGRKTRTSMPARTTAVTQAKCWRVELWLKLRNAHTKPGFRGWKCQRRARRKPSAVKSMCLCPPRNVAISGAISRVLNHWGTECRVPKTALNLHASMPSLLQAHASLSVVKASTAESGLNWDKEEM